jgi:hypothetical protein
MDKISSNNYRKYEDYKLNVYLDLDLMALKSNRNPFLKKHMFYPDELLSVNYGRN